MLKFFLVVILNVFMIRYASSAVDRADVGEKTPLLRTLTSASSRLEVSPDELTHELATRFELQNVQELSLKNSRTGRQTLLPETIEFLRGNVPSLRVFKCHGFNIPLQFIQELGAMINIKELELSSASLGLLVIQFPPLTGLTSLDLSENDLTDNTLVALLPLVGLTKLNLAYNNITAEGCVHLNALTRLQTLNLQSNLLADGALERMESLSSLTELDIRGGWDGNARQTQNPIGAHNLQSLEHFSLRVLKIGGVMQSQGYEGDYLLVLQGDASSFLLQLTQLDELDAYDASSTDDSLQHIGQLERLRKLNLGMSRQNPAMYFPTENSVKQAAREESIQSYKREVPKITGRGLSYLNSLRELEELSLQNQPIGRGALHIGNIENLQRLVLQGCMLQDEDISSLGLLTRLAYLNLSDNMISAGTAALSTLTNLTYLDLSYNCTPLCTSSGCGDYICLLTDESIFPLASLTALQELKLGTPRLTPASIEPLSRLQSLQTLEIGRYYFNSSSQKETRIRQARNYANSLRNSPLLEYQRMSRNALKQYESFGVFPEEDFQRLKDLLQNCQITLGYMSGARSSGCCCSIQ